MFSDPSPDSSPDYFLVSVSTRKNLELCIEHALAGFPSGESGGWTFCEIDEGDFVSFLYGARAYNLYRVSKREAFRAPEDLPPPCEPLTFGKKKKIYFPFGLRLRQERLFEEPLVRPEFAYVAENLLRRGGYSKTHFQADQTTLQSVSEMGKVVDNSPSRLNLPDDRAFVPRFSRTKSLIHSPEVLHFRETILQSAIRRHLGSTRNLEKLLDAVGLNRIQAHSLEILGEKALPEGHIDLLLKERTPMGSALKIPIEVKTRTAQPKDVGQLLGYKAELHRECPVALLIAEDFSKKTKTEAIGKPLKLIRYTLSTDLKKTPTFQEIFQGLSLESVLE